MTNKRFFNIFNLTEAEAIELLDTPLDKLAEDESRYVAASHLINFPTTAAIDALIRAIDNNNPELDNRIVRRKSVETLGKLQAKQGLPAIRTCLSESDCYTVENAVWAIGEIGTEDPEILSEIAQILDREGQNHRVIIHTLVKLNYLPALDRIRTFTESSDEATASAAIAAVCRFTGDYTPMARVMEFLFHPSRNARRACIQDLIDTNYYPAISTIARCPVSIVFRLRAIRLLANNGIERGEIEFADIQSSLEQTLLDRPQDLELIHEYDLPPTLEFLIRQLYETDFGLCYLATQTILDNFAELAPAALLATYEAEAYNDYGAHYHIMKLFGWLKYAPGYDLLVEALNNREPQFQKSRAAAALALGELGDKRAIPLLVASLDTKIWDLKYAILMALAKLGDTSGREITANDDDWIIRARAAGEH
ncbi:HEAT repeat domain-containing protein [Chamaesiphon sp. GL140_3_metabinner_50]|uniref:HEAT repeat domain-containing protein n=1 Tax=Chamaesiphon sp. GL140_3_metabinner_50 TaxID=2970812 RepID=UPI0025DBB7B0|nr:HEAT repeat domain-containing protein [Chamaesiphon sp. GL140_3_metabinner_50]